MSDTKKPEFCPACRRTFKTIQTLKQHMMSRHWRNRRFTCDTCRSVYYDPAAKAKCTNRHLGMWRCYAAGCQHKGRSPADVRKHLQVKHGIDNPVHEHIMLDDSLAKPGPPKRRRDADSWSFAPYEVLSREQLISESRRVRLEESSAAEKTSQSGEDAIGLYAQDPQSEVGQPTNPQTNNFSLPLLATSPGNGLQDSTLESSQIGRSMDAVQLGPSQPTYSSNLPTTLSDVAGTTPADHGTSYEDVFLGRYFSPEIELPVSALPESRIPQFYGYEVSPPTTNFPWEPGFEVDWEEVFRATPAEHSSQSG